MRLACDNYRQLIDLELPEIGETGSDIEQAVKNLVANILTIERVIDTSLIPLAKEVYELKDVCNRMLRAELQKKSFMQQDYARLQGDIRQLRDGQQQIRADM